MSPPPPLLRKVAVKGIEPLSLGITCALVYGVITLLLVPVLIVLALHRHMPITPLFYIAPFLYAGAGFVTGLLGSLIYNLSAKITGGIRLTLE